MRGITSSWRTFLSGWIGLLWLLASHPASGLDLNVIQLTQEVRSLSLDDRSRFWVDTAPPGLQLDIQALEARVDILPWRVRERGHQYSIDGQALWFQFDAQTHAAHSYWYVELAASGLDRAVLYYRDAHGQWVTQEAGDTKAVSTWPLPGRFPTFQLSSQVGQPVRYWLRVEHARVNFSAPIAIHPLALLARSRDREQFLLGAYFGLVAVVTLVAALSALAWRDMRFASYALYVATLGLGQGAYLGVGAQYLWTEFLEWNRVSTFVLPAISSAIGLWFVRGVTETARHARWLNRLTLGTMLLLATLTIADALTLAPGTYRGISLLILFSLLLMGGMIGLAWRRGEDPEIHLIALGFLPVVIFALFPLARTLGLLPVSFFTRYGLPLGAALEMPVLLYALNVHSSRRREAQIRARALATTDPLTGLAHRRILMVRLEAALLRARKPHQPLSCALLVVRAANMDILRATHGPEAAERALVLTASRLRSVISDLDMAARVGEQHFALLMEGPVTGAQAQLCATHVVARGLHTSPMLPAGVTLRLHVAAALLPAGALTAEQTLEWTLDAANAMPADGTKSIRTLNF